MNSTTQQNKKIRAACREPPPQSITLRGLFKLRTAVVHDVLGFGDSVLELLRMEREANTAIDVGSKVANDGIRHSESLVTSLEKLAQELHTFKADLEAMLKDACKPRHEILDYLETNSNIVTEAW